MAGLSASDGRLRRHPFVGLTLLFGAATLLLGGAGIHGSPVFRELAAEQGSFVAWTDLAMDAATLLALQQPAVPPQNALYGWARVSALAFASMAVLTVLIHVSRSLRLALARRWVRLLSRLRPERAPTVVIGASPVARGILEDVRTPGDDESASRPAVAILPRGEEEYREEAEALGAVVVEGEAREHRVRKRALLDCARDAIIATGEGEDNIEVAADLLRDVRAGRLGRGESGDGSASSPEAGLRCHVHAPAPHIAPLFRTHDLLASTGVPMRVDVFDAHEQAARDLFLREDRGLAPSCMPDEDEVFHLFLFGFGAMGQTLAAESGRLAHYPNDRRLRLSVVDDFSGEATGAAAATARADFLERYPAFCPDPSEFDLLAHVGAEDRGRDDWEYRDARPASEQARRDDPDAVEYVANAEFLSLSGEPRASAASGTLLRRLAPGQSPAVRPALVVCYDDQRKNFRTALQLYDELSSQPPGRLPSPCPIYVYLPTEEGLADLIRGVEANRPGEGHTPATVHPFGARERTCSYSAVTRPLLRNLAREIHEAYRASYGGPPFGELSPRLRASNEEAAAHALVKLYARGYRRPRESFREYGEERNLGDREELARTEHNRWMAERLMAGWRYTPRPEGYAEMSEAEKDSVREEMERRKVRPSLVPWEALSEDERRKDREQVNLLERLLAAE